MTFLIYFKKWLISYGSAVCHRTATTFEMLVYISPVLCYYFQHFVVWAVSKSKISCFKSVVNFNANEFHVFKRGKGGFWFLAVRESVDPRELVINHSNLNNSPSPVMWGQRIPVARIVIIQTLNSCSPRMGRSF